MPIRFEQPQPYAPQISSAYGAAQAQAQANPLLARLAEFRASQISQDDQFTRELAARVGAQNADRASAAMQANYDRGVRVDMANADRRTAAQESRGRLAQADDEANFRRQVHYDSLVPSARDQFFVDAEAARGQQRLQQQLMLMDAEVSQAERQQMQRLEYAKTAVAKDLRDGRIDQEVADAMLTEIHTGLNPLKQKAAAYAARQEQMAFEQMNKQAMWDAATEKTNAALGAQGFPERIISIPHPLGGEPIVGYWNSRKGEFVPFETAAAKDDPVKREMDLWKLAKEHAEAAAGPDVVDEYTGKVSRSKAKQDEYNAFLLSKFQELQAAQGSQRLGTPPPAPAQTAAPPPQAGGDTQAQAPKPFKLDDPKTQTPVQRLVVSAAQAEIATIKARTDLPQETKDVALHSLTRMQELLAAHGSVEAMPAEERAEYNSLKAAFATIPRGPGQGPATRPPTSREWRAAMPFMQQMVRPPAEDSVYRNLAGGR